MLDEETSAELHRIPALFRRARRVTLTGHVNADGDVYGSLSALYHRLAGRGVEQVHPYLFEPLPERYDFLGGTPFRIFQPEDPAQAEEILASDLLCILDLSVPERLPGWEKILGEFRGTVINVDHHPPPAVPLGTVNVVSDRASSTGELLFRLFRLEGPSIGREEALGLFTALATDTGWFRYANTRPETLEAAAALIREGGVDPTEVYGWVYQRNDLGYMRLVGGLLSGVKTALDGRLLWAVLTREALREAGVEDLDTEDLLDLLRSVRGSRCVAFFRERKDGSVRVNLRSKGDLAVNEVARRFGGGGHPRAAGVTLADGSLRDVESRVVEALKAYMQARERGEAHA